MSERNRAFSKLKNDVGIYFRSCPLCLSEGFLRFEFPSTILGKIHLICSECGAKWHINYGKTAFDFRFKWAKLVKADIHGIGNDLLNKEYEPEFWQRTTLRLKQMVQERSIEQSLPSKPKLSKNAISGKKVLCRYCETKNTEDSVYCKECGKKLG